MSQIKSKTLKTSLKARKRNTEKKKNSTSSSQLLHPTSATLQTALSQTINLPTFRETPSSLSSRERL